MARLNLPIANILLVGVIVLEVAGGARPPHFQDQLTNLLKNLSIFGGMRLLAQRGLRQVKYVLRRQPVTILSSG